jgi:hypothetical protein
MQRHSGQLRLGNAAYFSGWASHLGNRSIDAEVRKRARCKGNGWSRL